MTLEILPPSFSFDDNSLIRYTSVRGVLSALAFSSVQDSKHDLARESNNRTILVDSENIKRRLFWLSDKTDSVIERYRFVLFHVPYSHQGPVVRILRHR